MGCATSMCSCTQTAVATVTPRAHSHTHIVHGNPRGPNRRSAGSNKSGLAHSLGSVDRNSSLWSSYDLEIRDIDEFSDGGLVRGPFEIESDGDGCKQHSDHCNNNRSLISHNSNHSQNGSHIDHNIQHNSHNRNAGNLLSENSKWTVTVRLYTQKAADQRSSDIPSVEETGSHFSSGEFPGKSGSSQGSRGSGKRVMQPMPATNGIISSDYKQRQYDKHSSRNLRPKRLHHSHSERPLTKDELAQHDKMKQTQNPTYAWGKGHEFSSVYSNDVQQSDTSLVNDKQILNEHPTYNGFQGKPQKYEHSGFLSTYLSLGTNHYRSMRTCVRDSNQRKNTESEETWQSLCDSSIPPRPMSSHHTNRGNRGRGSVEVGDHEEYLLPSPSPIDSLITDYLAETEIMEDFSGSTHSLTNLAGTSGKANSGDSSGRGTTITTPRSPSEEGLRDKEVTMVDSCQDNRKYANRPRAALRRHRSEPFHFLV